MASNLRRHLVQHASLRCLSRHTIRAAGPEEVVVVDYNNAASLRSGLRGCDALVHLAGSGAADRGRATTHANAGVTALVARAAAAADIGKIIFLSGLGVSAHNTSTYFASKLQAEQHVIESGIDYTIFRPSFIVGRNDYLTKKLNRQARCGRIIIPGDGRYIIQPIHVSDACGLIAEALSSRSVSKRTFDMVGPEKIRFDLYVRSMGYNCPIERMRLEECLHGALNVPQYPYTLEDLYILFGRYVGDFKRLRRAFKAPIGAAGQVRRPGRQARTR